MSDDFYSKLRFRFRLARGSAQVAARLEETSKVTRKRSNNENSDVTCPQDGDKPRKTVEHLTSGESPQSFSTQESLVSHPQDQTSHVGDSYVSSESARTGWTTASPGSFYDQVIYPGPVLPTAYESGPCSRSGDLEERSCIAYRHIRSLPHSSISPNNTRMIGDGPRKQLRVPHHSVIDQPMPNILPNPHAIHARSRSRPIPSSFPHKSRPASWIHEGFRSTPPIRHAKPQAQSPNRRHHPQSLPQCSLQMDTNVHLNDPTTSLILHPSQSMILQPVLAAPVHTGIGGPLMPRQEIDAEPLLQKKTSKLIKKRHSATLPATTASHLSYHFAAEKASVSSNQVLNSNEDICIQDHLPVVRPPSPFQLDIPTHQPWHDRRTNFDLLPMRGHRSRVSVSSPLTAKKTSSSTEALASLAWIGTPPAGTPISTSCIPSHYTKSNAVPINQDINISMAVDENLPDEVVVERLEIIRKQTRKDKHSPGTTGLGLAGTPPSSKQGFSLSGFRLREHSTPNTGSTCQTEESEHVSESLTASMILDDADLDSNDAAVWRTARKALFCIREIIRTERKYQEALKALLAGQTANPPPPLMLSYLPDLIRVSEALLKAFIDDPSAWGVSAAFMTCEDDIESAMVSWSSVAGGFFTDSPSKGTESASIGAKWRRRKSLLLSATGNPLPLVVGKSSGHSSPASPTAFRPLLSLTNETGSRIRERQRTGSIDSSTERSRSRVNSMDEQDGRADDSKRELPTRRQSVRDLAIQPTQRVMRYVLLYQDLLENTPPTSPPRALVERALEAATHIASKCDRAQGNTAFLRK